MILYFILYCYVINLILYLILYNCVVNLILYFILYCYVFNLILYFILYYDDKLCANVMAHSVFLSEERSVILYDYVFNYLSIFDITIEYDKLSKKSIFPSLLISDKLIMIDIVY